MHAFALSFARGVGEESQAAADDLFKLAVRSFIKAPPAAAPAAVHTLL